MRRFYRPLGMAALSLALLAIAGPALADRDGNNGWHRGWWQPRPGPQTRPTSAPEIDPSALGSLAALLTSGFLILRDRRRR